MTVQENLPLSLHHIDSAWVNQRARELSDARGHKRPDIKGALSDAADQFVDEVGDNFDVSRDLAVYQPSADTDPYIIAVPIKEAVVTGLPAIPPINPLPVPAPVPFKLHEVPNTIQDDFENALFETEVGATPAELAKDSEGRYIHSRIRLLWFGFNLYHQKMTMARRAEFREPYHKPLGTYIVGKVYENGGTVFTKVPVRFRTKALAFEEAHRLQSAQGEAWGIWRCIDIIGKEDVKQDEENPSEQKENDDDIVRT